MAILLDAVGSEPAARLPSRNVRTQAEEHVAHCSDCWQVVSLLHELATGKPPPEADRMPTLYHCEQVQDDLYSLESLSPYEVKTRYPEVARHLGWCHSCRDRLVDILQIGRAAARGEFGSPAILTAKPRWRETAGVVGERIRELVGHAVVQVRKGLIELTAVPDGLAVAPALALAGARRGEASPGEVTDEPGQGHRVWLTLGESGLMAELTLRSQGADRVGVTVRVEGATEDPLAVSLRKSGAKRMTLVGSETVRGEEAAILHDLPAGEYVLEIQQKREKARFRVSFSVETDA
jgi:hypothetical protein